MLAWGALAPLAFTTGVSFGQLHVICRTGADACACQASWGSLSGQHTRGYHTRKGTGRSRSRLLWISAEERQPL